MPNQLLPNKLSVYSTVFHEWSQGYFKDMLLVLGYNNCDADIGSDFFNA